MARSRMLPVQALPTALPSGSSDWAPVLARIGYAEATAAG